MYRKVFALSVGIDRYPQSTARLSGCVNDAQNFLGFLHERYGKAVESRLLKDADATRKNVIVGFREFLSRARAQDAVVFFYAGHGAQTPGSAAFKSLFPDGLSEGLVLFDSRQPGDMETALNFDLADKELAILLEEVASNGAHTTVILDCCHSGAATRGIEQSTEIKARYTHPVRAERPLETYLDGHYARLARSGAEVIIPRSRHIVLTACDKFQQALELRGSGVFTSCLIKALKNFENDLSYVDLFDHCRAELRQISRALGCAAQDPQLDSRGDFDRHDGFLGGRINKNTAKFCVSFRDGRWVADCGVVDGLANEQHQPAELQIFSDRDCTQQVVGALATDVRLQNCCLEVQSSYLKEGQRYYARIAKLPSKPLMLRVLASDNGMDEVTRCLEARRDDLPGIDWTDDRDIATDYEFTQTDSQFVLKQLSQDRVLFQGKLAAASQLDELVVVLRKIANWERLRLLHNPRGVPLSEKVAFQLNLKNNGTTQSFAGDREIVLNIKDTSDETGGVFVRLQANNGYDKPLNFMLLHFSDSFAIKIMYANRISPCQQLFDLEFYDCSELMLYLPDDATDRCTDRFKLIASEQQIDGFGLAQLGIDDRLVTRDVTAGQPLPKDKLWTTKDLIVQLVREPVRSR